MDSVIDGLDNYKTMAEQVMASDRVKQEFATIVLDVVYDGFKAKAGSPSPASAPLGASRSARRIRW